MPTYIVDRELIPLSGEHGIGLVQKPYMDIAFDEKSLDLMRGIKSIFDPNGILNPGKIF